MTHRNRIRQTLAAATLLGVSFASQAAELGDVSGRMISGVGQWIAAQGNAALEDIRDDLRDNLNRQLKPLRPQPPQPELHKVSADGSEAAADADRAL